MEYNKDFIISFVRHAESRGNVGIPYEPEFQKDDPPLSPRGIIQAEKLGKSSVTDGIDRIFSSTLIRAVQTAYPTAEKLNKEIVLLSDLVEFRTAIAGTDRELLINKYPLAGPCFTYLNSDIPLSENETAEMSALRAKRCIDYFFQVANEGDHILVVSHGTYFGYLLRAALGLSLPESFCWQVDNCSMTRVIFRKDALPKLSFANYTGYLSE